jgi:hypothetical protein
VIDPAPGAKCSLYCDSHLLAPVGMGIAAQLRRFAERSNWANAGVDFALIGPGEVTACQGLFYDLMQPLRPGVSAAGCGGTSLMPLRWRGPAALAPP